MSPFRREKSSFGFLFYFYAYLIFTRGNSISNSFLNHFLVEQLENNKSLKNELLMIGLALIQKNLTFLTIFK